MKKTFWFILFTALSHSAHAQTFHLQDKTAYGKWQSPDHTTVLTVSAKGLSRTPHSPEPAGHCAKRHIAQTISSQTLRQNIQASIDSGISDEKLLRPILAKLKNRQTLQQISADYPCADGGVEHFIRIDKHRALYILSAPEDWFVPLYRK